MEIPEVLLHTVHGDQRLRDLGHGGTLSDLGPPDVPSTPVVTPW
jgi:hypothetical protein